MDPSALIGEDTGSFQLSRQSAATFRIGAATTEPRRSAMTDAVLGEDSGSAYFASLPLGPGMDRAAVVAELDQARASGQLAALVCEDSGSAWLARTASGMRTSLFDVGPDLADRPSLHHASAALEAQTR